MKLHLICQIAMYCKTALTLKAKKIMEDILNNY